MSKKYDFLIVGAGFAGASCARLLTDKGYKCLIIEERPFVSGNCASDNMSGIEVHIFGGHVLHTNNDNVWNFIKSYDDIVEHRYDIMGWNDGKIAKLPLSMEFANFAYGKTWPHEASIAIENDKVPSTNAKTIEEYALANFGKAYYEFAIKDYYEKLYKTPCSELPWQLIEEKMPDALTFESSFYNDEFQGVPRNGYVKLVENIIGDDIDIMLNKNFLDDKDKFMSYANYTIYTGELDRFFNYCMGAMGWISLNLELRDESDKTSNLAGAPIVRFCGKTPQWHRMTEHKWLAPWNDSDEAKSHTIVTYEYSTEWEIGKETFYPLWDERSLNLYSRYLNKLHAQYPKVLLCGRRAKYNTMHICDVIEDAMKLTDKFPIKH